MRNPLQVLMPRLWHRIRHGHWCEHDWTQWHMIDLGRRKMRWCTRCDHAEVV